MRHSLEKMTFLPSNRSSGHRSVRYNIGPPSSLPFKVVPPSFQHGLLLLATLIRGGRGLQAQDHGQPIYAKIRYSVSSTLQLVVALVFLKEMYQETDILVSLIFDTKFKILQLFNFSVFPKEIY